MSEACTIFLTVLSSLTIQAPQADGPVALKEALAEADRLDPGWRLAEVEARRTKVSPDRNGATRVQEVLRALPESWKEKRKPGDPPLALDRLATDGELSAFLDTFPRDPSRRLPEEWVAALTKWQRRLDAPLKLARSMEGYPTGRYPVTYDRNFIGTKFPHVAPLRYAVSLLRYDGHARAYQGEIDSALASARAMLNVGRSLGDEPFAISQMVRMATESAAVEVIELALAQGEASDAALVATQKALADEAAEPLMLILCRGERAGIDDVFDKLATGEIKPRDLFGETMKYPAAFGKETSFYQESQAIALRTLTRAVEIAKKPIPEQVPLWDRWLRDQSPRPSPRPDARTFLSSGLVPTLLPVFQAFGRTRALLRSAELAVGLERVRLSRKEWPKPGDPLALAFKDGTPADPFTGKPMKWKPTNSGLVVYSASFDRGDHGGNLENKNVKIPGTDIGFRLWDAKLRGKAEEPEN
jgi:hypothetical protein